MRPDRTWIFAWRAGAMTPTVSSAQLDVEHEVLLLRQERPGHDSQPAATAVDRGVVEAARLGRGRADRYSRVT
jgi:hypothetical protein